MLPILLTMAMALLPAGAGIIYLLGPASVRLGFKASHLPIEGEWFSTGNLLWAKAMVSETALQGDLNPAGVGEGLLPILPESADLSHSHPLALALCPAGHDGAGGSPARLKSARLRPDLVFHRGKRRQCAASQWIDGDAREKGG